ncbi:hypothetical protein L2E82_25996 [Cichorium intybus]|uniref:Uncharacterized protein n=1 Tax=Cichorium intybus TaxID=13427 RepID=A0ACB9E576_CICIN|nr:hypothetical protein L2E82_25996 [Cichorium intybus]
MISLHSPFAICKSKSEIPSPLRDSRLQETRWSILGWESCIEGREEARGDSRRWWLDRIAEKGSKRGLSLKVLKNERKGKSDFSIVALPFVVLSVVSLPRAFGRNKVKFCEAV